MTHILLAPQMQKGAAFPTMFDRDPLPKPEDQDEDGVMAFFTARVAPAEREDDAADT